MELCSYGKDIQNSTLGCQHTFLLQPWQLPQLQVKVGRVWREVGREMPELVISCYITNHPTVYQHKTTNVHYLKVSEGQESGSILARWFQLRVSQEAAFKMSTGAAVILRVHWGWKIHSQFGSFNGCWLEGLSFSLAVDRNPQFLATRSAP